MSVKRQATTELNHDNWDKVDEPEVTEGFKTASKEILEKRVIRTAKRRSNATNSEGQKSAFSGFGGFNKVQKTSFDFLANLTNGQNSTNAAATNKDGSSLFTNAFSNQGTSLFTPSAKLNEPIDKGVGNLEGSPSVFTTKPFSNQSTGLFTPSVNPNKSIDTCVSNQEGPSSVFITKPFSNQNTGLFTPSVNSNKSTDTYASNQEKSPPLFTSKTFSNPGTMLFTPSAKSNKLSDTDVGNQEGSGLFSTKPFSNQSTALFTPSVNPNKSTDTVTSNQEGSSGLFSSKTLSNQSTSPSAKSFLSSDTGINNPAGSFALFSPKSFSNQSTALFTPSVESNKLSNTQVNNKEGSSSSLFSSKAFSNQSIKSVISNKSTDSGISTQEGSSLFTIKGLSSPTDAAKPVTSLFENKSMPTASILTKSPVAESKTDLKSSESPFKIQSSLTPMNNLNNSIKLESGNDCSTVSQKSNNVFGAQGNNVFANNCFNISPASNTLSALSSNNCQSVEESKKNVKKGLKPITIKVDKNIVINEKTIHYYENLTGLNISLSEWIKKNVDESPMCILSSIFEEYNSYLKQIQDEFCRDGAQGDYKQKSNGDKMSSDTDNTTATVLPQTSGTLCAPTILEDKKPATMVFGSKSIQGKEMVSPFGNVPKVQNPTTPLSTAENTKLGFSFGSTTAGSTVTTNSGGFTFGINTSHQTTSLFSTKPTVSTTNGNSQFSFGSGEPFSFNTNIQRKDESSEKTNTNEEDEPPKIEYTPMVEENSVFDIKCKVFVKKDGNFVDKGVGTLNIKKIEDSGKHQLFVRANTTLGNLLLNLVLSTSIPTQRMGKNNVMLVCIPTPDAKPPPIPVLIRVKTSEEADGLLEKINEYK